MVQIFVKSIFLQIKNEIEVNQDLYRNKDDFLLKRSYFKLTNFKI